MEPTMSAEFYKTKELEKSLKQWQSIEIKARKNLVTELGEMTIESATSDGEFAGACNSAANLLHAISKYPELLNIINEKHKQTNKE